MVEMITVLEGSAQTKKKLVLPLDYKMRRVPTNVSGSKDPKIYSYLHENHISLPCVFLDYFFN